MNCFLFVPEVESTFGNQITFFHERDLESEHIQKLYARDVWYMREEKG